MRSFIPESSVAERPRQKRGRFVPRLSDDPEMRSIQIGIGATVVVHLLLFWVIPDKFESDMTGSFTPQNMGVENKSFSIEMDPDEFVMMKPPAPKPPPMKYVETNPDAPDNEPDKTNNFSSQNQQAAQEKAPKKDGGDHPEMEGRKDMESNQVVTGSLSKPAPLTPPPPPPPSEAAEAEKAAQLQREQNPLPGLEKYTGENKDSFGSNIAKIAPHPEDLVEKVEGSPDAPLIQGVPGKQSTVAHQERPQPRERPKLDRNVRPAIFSENLMGTSNIGAAAYDARWSNYGTYLKRLMDTVQMQWDALIEESRSYPTHGSVVKVKFILTKTGEVRKVTNVDAGVANQLAESWCVASITKPAPYGKWTDDMVAMLGEEQEMTFAFYYQ